MHMDHGVRLLVCAFALCGPDVRAGGMGSRARSRSRVLEGLWEKGKHAMIRPSLRSHRTPDLRTRPETSTDSVQFSPVQAMRGLASGFAVYWNPQDI
eukprot:3586312-Rhodomonas_salina.2